MIRTSCRICSSPMRDVLDLGAFVPSDFIGDQAEPERVPLTLVECDRCGLVQLRHTLDRDVLYRNYWYLSGLNPSMVVSLRDVVAGIEARVQLQPGDVVIDVGANDGTLLTLYSAPGLYKIGFDPAVNLASGARERCDKFVNDYFESSAEELPPAKVLTSIAMFYDLDDPRKFVARVREALHPEGVWVVQMTDLVRMLRANAFDNICHEHLCYYSLSVLSSLVESCGMRVFDVEFNDVNGGSLRAYISRTGTREQAPSVKQALDDELEYLAAGGLESFRSRVLDAKARVCDFIRRERAAGRTFHALGASTKGNTLLQFFGLSDLELDCAAEVNPAKYGLRTAGTNVRIVSQEESFALAPDYYLVLPWHFIEFFRTKHAEYLAAGGKLLTPLPYPTVYERDHERRLDQE